MTVSEFSVADPTAQLGRFVVTNRPTVSPGNCVVCGYAGADRQYIDFRLDFEFYGSVYLCVVCLHDAGNCVGMASTELHQTTLATIKEQNEIIEELRESLRLSEQTVDLLSQRRLSDRARSNASPELSSSNADGETEPEDYRHVKRPVAQPPKSESRPAESVDEPRPDDVGTFDDPLLSL